jgi:hypothetical protein
VAAFGRDAETPGLQRHPPVETDVQEYFRVSAPSVHQMVLTFERGFIRGPPMNCSLAQPNVGPALIQRSFGQNRRAEVLML